MARPQNLALLLTHCGQLIARKISKFDATRYQILRLKCTKFDFGWGYSTDPAGEAYSANRDPLCLRGPTSTGMDGEKGERKREGKMRGEGRKGARPPIILA